MTDWKQLFDKIYCIHYLPSTSRLTYITNELERVGILQSGVFEWKNTTDSPFYKLLQPHITTTYESMKYDINAFKTALMHYEVWRDALGRGFNRVLILENDVAFLRDLAKLEDALRDFPLNADVVLLDKYVYGGGIEYNQKLKSGQFSLNKTFGDFSNGFAQLGSAACYSVSREAADAFIKQQEISFMPADEIWNNPYKNAAIAHLRKAFALENIACQKMFPGSITPSIAYSYKWMNIKFEDYYEKA